MFIGSSLGLNYPAPGTAPGPDQFDNVFVNPSSYRAFMQTGKWPDKTIWVLEFRGVGKESVAEPDGSVSDEHRGVRSEREGLAVSRRLGVLRVPRRRDERLAASPATR